MALRSGHCDFLAYLRTFCLMPVNIEIKARCPDPELIARILRANSAEHKGRDHQVDTYFAAKTGRLKLREGNIENNLIYYCRNNVSGPKKSEVVLYPAGKNPGLKNILRKVLGIKTIVDKQRDIYFIDNVKFHIDRVKDLGDFVEIEAIGEAGQEETLNKQCRFYMDLLMIHEDNLIGQSYSDLLMENNK